MSEVTVLYVQVCAMTYANAILCRVILCAILPQAVSYMHITITYAWATLSATMIPPAIYECRIKVTFLITAVA
jgi:hypothetical protein